MIFLFSIYRIVVVYILVSIAALASSQQESLQSNEFFRGHYAIEDFEIQRFLSASSLQDVVALTPFIIEFHLRNGAVLADEITTAESVVYSYLEAYMNDYYHNTTNDDLELMYFQTELSSHSHAGEERNILVLEFNSTATFVSNSSVVPTQQELDSVLAPAFQSGRKAGFLELLEYLPEENFFRETRDVLFAFASEDQSASAIRFVPSSITLSHYKLSFRFKKSVTPSPLDFPALERVTTIYLASSILRESGLTDTEVEDFSTLVIKHIESSMGYVVEFESVIELTAEGSSVPPSVSNLDAIRSRVFSQQNIHEYQELLKSLPAGNSFAEAVVVLQEGEIIPNNEASWIWGVQEITLLVIFILGFIMLVCGMHFYLRDKRRIRRIRNRRLERHPSLEKMHLQIPSVSISSSTQKEEDCGPEVLADDEEDEEENGKKIPKENKTKPVTKDCDQGQWGSSKSPPALEQTTSSKLPYKKHQYDIPPNKTLGLHQLYSEKCRRHNAGFEANQRADIAGRYELETEVSSVTGTSYLLYRADKNRREDPFIRLQRSTALSPRHRMISFQSDLAVSPQEDDTTIISQLENQDNCRSTNPTNLNWHETYDDSSIMSEVSSFTGITNFLNRTISFRRKPYVRNRATTKRKQKSSYRRVVKERPRALSEDETIASSKYLHIYESNRLRD